MSATTDKPLVGFAGLGKMGAAMALNLLKGGFTVKLYNRTRTATDAVVEQARALPGRAIAVATPMELADVHVLFTMVENDTAIRSVVIDSGLLAALGSAHPARPVCSAYTLPTTVHICCATLPVAFVRELVKVHASHHVEYVSMPVIGRPDAAAAGKLHLLFAGSDAAREYLQPLLLVPVMGQSLRNYGTEQEKANVMKITFNFTLASALEAMAEGAALVQKYGMEPRDYTNLLSETLFDCTAYNGYGTIIANRQFQPAGATLAGVGLKDSKLALQAGEDAAVPLPFASAYRDRALEGIANGMAEWDWSAVAVVAERNAGIVRKD